LKRNNILQVALFLLSVSLSAQADKLHFRVVTTDSTSVSGINVVNMVNEKSATTNSGGEFTIMAKAEDLLVLQKETFEYTRYLIEPEDLAKPVIIIKMVPKPIALREVVVTQRALPDDLFKKHSDHRKFTPAEKKLYTARSGIFDPVINWMSGRTTMLKKELDVEMKERLLARVETLYDDDYYVETLKIPQEYIGDFKRYMIDNDAFVSALKAKNKTLIRFESAKLATSYRQLMSAVIK
jgi:hypothetical protein